MSEEPSFSTKPLSDETDIKPKKPARKRRAPEASAPAKENLKQTKISKQLTQIYQDDQGHLPDMKKIKIKKTHSAFKTFVGVIFVGGLLAATAWAGFFFMPSDQKFSEDKVELSVNGPSYVTAGTTTTYKIAYENKQNITLKKLTLNVQYPDGFVFLSSDVESKNAGHTEWNLGEIAAGKKKEVSITGISYGSIGQKQSWRSFLKYKPENFESELQKATILDVTVDKSPFSLTVNGSNKTLVGNASEYTFIVKKESNSAITKLELKPSWPKNFVITSTSVPLTKDFKWIIEPNKKLSPTSSVPESWTFKITGNFTGNSSGTISQEGSSEISGALLTSANNKTFGLTDNKITTQLAQNDLNFNLAINGSLSSFNTQPGEDLNITISLKNQSKNDLKNAILKLSLVGPSIKKVTLLDWSKIEDQYDGDIQGQQIADNLRKGEITWGKSKISSLTNIAGGKEIGVDIKLPIKDSSSFNLSDLATSSQITVVADIGFKDEEGVTHNFSSNQIIITVNSDLKFDARDTVSPSGKGEKHQLNWVLTNSFHPLKNLTLTAEVYGDVNVELPTPIPAGSATFNPQTKKITWSISEMPESVDVLALPITILLNKINPTQALLVSKVHVQAEDTVTGEKLDFLGDEIKFNR